MKYYILLAVIVFCGSSALAQDRRHDRDEKIKSLKIAYITEKLDLTSEVSQQFWPIYNGHEKARREIWRQSKKADSSDEISEEEALAVIQERISRDEEFLAEDKRYIEALKNVISAKQIVKLYEVEREFKHKMIRTLQDKRKTGKMDKKSPK